MSYILDALKKSEQQRNSLDAPEEVLVNTRPAASEKRRISLPLMLLVIALAGGWFIMRFQQSDNNQAPLTASKPALVSISPKVQAPVAKVAPPLNSMPKAELRPTLSSTTRPEQPTSAIPRRHTPPTPTKPAIVPVFKPITPASPVSRANTQLPDLPSESAQASPAETSIKSRSELPIAIQQSLPSIRIEGHIYDESPAKRMVIINGKIHREKQRISANLKLEEITPNGVILDYQGHVFHLGVFER